ncbi:hypothetical protein [Streptomyces aureus]|uniref:hypothetical protein n=1 Tax=Streptomyces aureus TaxID=193461 RepID=UPI000562381F|nr:hypothetical protein [Streptomyces aureus]
MDRADGPDCLAASAETYDAVQAAINGVAPHWAGGQPVTLNGLFVRWRGLVHEVEESYLWCAPELGNDIWCRGVLARIWPRLPARVRECRQPELDALDERYRRATIPWPGHADDGDDWWSWRVPRRLEIEASEQRGEGWPSGWEMMPFPKPDSVEVIARG